MTRIENMQVFKQDGRNKFVEVCGDTMPDLEKIKINFIEYNSQNETGSKVEKQITFYLDINEAEYLATQIISSGLEKQMVKNEMIQKEGGHKYPLPACKTDPMGTNKKDKPIESREMSINRSNTAGYYIITGEAGQGRVKKNDGTYITTGDGWTKGLIEKAYDYKSATRISVQISNKELKKMGLAIKRLCYAYETTKYSSYSRDYKKRKAERQNGYSA